MEQLALAGIEIIIEVVFTYFLVSKSTSKLKKILILYIEESKKAQGKEMEVLGLIDKKNDLFFKQIKIQLGELFESLIEIITKNLLDHERKRRTKTNKGTSNTRRTTKGHSRNKRFNKSDQKGE